MDIMQIYHFLFETIPGIGVLVGVGLVVSILLCFIFEWRTRKIFRNHAKEDDIDEWELLEDVWEGEAEAEAEAEAKAATKAAKGGAKAGAAAQAKTEPQAKA